MIGGPDIVERAKCAHRLGFIFGWAGFFGFVDWAELGLSRGCYVNFFFFLNVSGWVVFVGLGNFFFETGLGCFVCWLMGW
jgi:hypothetical protein